MPQITQLGSDKAKIQTQADSFLMSAKVLRQQRDPALLPSFIQLKNGKVSSGL